MSRVGMLERLYQKDMSNFDYDKLLAPPLYSLIPPDAVNRLYKIATSLRYSGNINKKYEMMDEIMNMYGFRKAHAGTNRVVYHCLEIPYLVAKVAVDRVGIGDSPAEFKNQTYFKPFCCKIFEVDPTGVIALVERVNPITSIEEFVSVNEDIFNLITTKIVGKYALDDIGVTKFMNYGIRPGFGPVILDYPYAYEIDGRKLYCNKSITTPRGEIKCGGEIDYNIGFDNLICTKCKRIYQARDLGIDGKIKLIMYDKERRNNMTRARIIDGEGNVIKDSGVLKSDTYVSKDRLNNYNGNMPKPDENGIIKVDRVIRPAKRTSKEYQRNKYYNDIKAMMEKNSKATKATIKTVPVNNLDKDTKVVIHHPAAEPNKPISETTALGEIVGSKSLREDIDSYIMDAKGKIRYKGKFASKSVVESFTEEEIEYIKNNPKSKFEPATGYITSENPNKEEEPEKDDSDEPELTQDYIDNLNLFSGSNKDEEDDNMYKDYIPDDEEDEPIEEEDESVPYNEYVEQFKEKKNSSKPRKFNDFNDMADF